LLASAVNELARDQPDLGESAMKPSPREVIESALPK
jgi:hypothetical protein